MTTVPSFNDLLPIRRRFARARQINAQIARIRDAYLATDPARLQNRHNEDGQTEVVLDVVHEPSPALPYLAGESIHQVRAALDNLVLILAEHARGATLSDGEAQSLQFPITSKLSGFENALQRGSLKGLDSELVTKIREVQPFERYTFSGTPFPPHQHVLSRLQALSNQDKHRRVTVISRQLDRLTFGLKETGTPAVPAKPRIAHPPYADGDVVVTVNRPPTAFEVHPRVEIALEVPPFETPDGSRTIPQTLPLHAQLEILAGEIADVVLGHILGMDFALRAADEDPDLLLPM
ncbi:hypothetical protein ACIOWF_01065 [Cellulosimicrobium cellulans]|uniref:hypothetical protein n=1 Tax=Cellulosimicrobium cellulans TaxID=1710 RepID=UPI0038076FCD